MMRSISSTSSCGPTRATRAQTGRRTRAGRSATSARAGQGSPGGRDRACNGLHRAHLRQAHGRAASAGLPDRGPRATAAGETMRSLCRERPCHRGVSAHGVWEQLTRPALAAAVSTLLYNGRREDENRTPRIPGGPQGSARPRTRRDHAHVGADRRPPHRVRAPRAAQARSGDRRPHPWLGAGP